MAIETELQAWKKNLEAELTGLEEQEANILLRVKEKREKLTAIDRLLGIPSVLTESGNHGAGGTGSPSSAPTNGSSSVVSAFQEKNFTPVNAYWRPILEVLVEFGGKAERLKIVDAVGQKMKNILTPADYEELPNTHEVRWRNRVIWQASNMRQRGFIGKVARGIWGITPAGQKWLGDK